MSIATFYAVDKVLDYFKRKYPNFIEKVDERLFETKKIDKSVNLKIQDIEDINKKIFKHYIEVGKYELTRDS